MTTVYVYRNLHRNCWSIRHARSRKVLLHADELMLNDASFKVSQAGRQRVLRERRKNVHAGVQGTLDLMPELPARARWKQVAYNPYRFSSFVLSRTGEQVSAARSVLFDKQGRVWAVKPS